MKDFICSLVLSAVAVFILGSIIHYIAGEIEYWKWRKK